MKKTCYERIYLWRVRFGKRSKFHYIFATIILTVFSVFVKFTQLFAGNCKKLSVVFFDLLFFVVFSSLTFQNVTLEDTTSGKYLFSGIDENTSLELSGFRFQKPFDSQDIMTEEANITDKENEVQISDAESSDVAELENADAASILAELDPEIIRQTSSSKANSISDYSDYSFLQDDWRLILVNKQHSIPKDYTFTLGTIKGGLKCDERILTDLFRMLSDAAAAGVNLTVCSPYRTNEHQQELFQSKIENYMKLGMSYLEAYKLAGTAVTVPGTSEHEIGLALDIVSDTYRSLNEGFGETGAGQWLAQNCHLYGFILRYPKGKEYITTIEYEPWHFRYVGIEAATKIMKENITLEEFWEEVF